jgi:hypothetical protein
MRTAADRTGDGTLAAFAASLTRAERRRVRLRARLNLPLRVYEHGGRTHRVSCDACTATVGGVKALLGAEYGLEGTLALYLKGAEAELTDATMVRDLEPDKPDEPGEPGEPNGGDGLDCLHLFVLQHSGK